MVVYMRRRSEIFSPRGASVRVTRGRCYYAITAASHVTFCRPCLKCIHSFSFDLAATLTFSISFFAACLILHFIFSSVIFRCLFSPPMPMPLFYAQLSMIRRYFFASVIRHAMFRFRFITLIRQHFSLPRRRCRCRFTMMSHNFRLITPLRRHVNATPMISPLRFSLFYHAAMPLYAARGAWRICERSSSCAVCCVDI